jgi:hypothetical protein
MKSIVCASLLAFLLSFSVQLATAQTSGSSASGKFQFSLEDGYTKYVEFDARKQADGSTIGQVFFSDEATLVEQDLDGTGDPNLPAKYPGFYIKAEFDDLTVNKNQAVMSGTISDSSIRAFIGQRVLLTVEDNGDNTRVPDKLTWGIYKPLEKTETPTDAERKVDEGAGTRWTTSDAERKDDVEVVYPKDPTITSQSFEFPAYAFVDVERGAGDIQVSQ